MTGPYPESTASRPARSRTVVNALLARRHRAAVIAVVAGVALLAGVLVGRATSSTPATSASRVLEAEVLPLALDAEAIWTSATDGGSSVSEALVALRRDDDPAPTRDNLDEWLQGYDAALARIAGVNVAPVARPVQRQLITAVTLARDATEVLGHAARVEDGTARRDLVTEVGRLRARAEQLMQSARASIADLQGASTDISPLPGIRGILEGRAD